MSRALSWLGLGRGTTEPAAAAASSNLVVSKLLIHPIKSCRGTSVEQANYSIHGLEHDRVFMVIDAQTHKMVSAREFPKLVLVTPIIVGDQLVVSFPDTSKCPIFTVDLCPPKEVTNEWELISDIVLWESTVDGYVVEFSSESAYRDASPSEILSDYLCHPVILIYQGPTRRVVQPTESHPTLHETSSAIYHDGYPLLVVTEESFGQVQENMTKTVNGEPGWTGIGGFDKSKWKHTKLEMERFRPNIIISGSAEPFEEDRWKELQFGSQFAHVSLVSRSPRCQLPNIDPNTGELDKAVPYKVLAKHRRVDPAHPYTPCFGSNASPAGSGTIKVGDPVNVLSWFTRSTLPTNGTRK